MDNSQISLKFSPKTFLVNKGIYIIGFFVSMIILLVSYFIFGIYPFGDESVLVLDLNGQYVYYFENLRDAFWGDGSFINSWSRNLTGETMGIFAYYLASPFTLVVMLLPRSMMTTSLLIMQMLKVGTACITFSWYLRSSKKSAPYTALIFGMMYSLMGYMVVQLMDPMWLDGLIYLPIICRGIEVLIDKGRWLLFIIPLALMFIANFYIGWMIAIFCCVYFLAYYFFMSTETSPFRFKHMLLSGVKFASGGIIAAACAAWVLIPLYYSLSLGKFEFSTPDYTNTTQFDFIDFFVNLLPNVYDTCRPEGSPVICCGVMTLLLVPLYFLNSNIRPKQKLGFALLTLTVILSMYMSTVDLVWHGFQVPNWLPYRYSFTISFLLLIMAAQSFERIEGISYKEIGCTFAVLAAYVFYLDKHDTNDRLHIIAAIWFTVAAAAVYALFLYAHKKFYKVKPIPLAIAAFLIAELITSTTYTMYKIDKDVVYSNYSSYNRYITLGRNTVDKIYEMDTSPVYRIEKNFHRTVNDAMAFGTYGVSHSSSTLNAAPIQFLRKMGFSYGGHYTKYKGATYVTDALFGIKYVMEKGSATPPEADETVIASGEVTEPEVEIAKSKHYDNLVLANGDSKEIMYVYENPYALPIGFMADNAIADLEIDTWYNPFENQNLLLSALLSDEDQEFFKQIYIDETLPENAKPSTYGTHKKYVPRIEGSNSHIEFLFTAPTEDMIYMYFPSQYERKVNLWLNEEFVDYYYEGGNMVIHPLGRYSEGEEISLITTITEEKNEVLFRDNYIYYLDEEMFASAIDELNQNGLEVESFREDHIKGTITADEDGIMFTSIAYEPGWTVYVDGEKVEHVELVDALIGVPLTAGTHTIEMKFFPAGLKLGIIVSIVGVLTVIVIAIYERKNRTVMLDRLYDVK